MFGDSAIASLYAVIGADTKKFDSALRGVDRALNNSTRTFGGWQGVLAKGFAAVGVAAVGALAGTTAAVAKFTQKAADMEQSVADIAAVWNLTRDEMGKVDKLINALNLDPKLKVNAQGASDTIEMLAKNGLTLDQVMNGAARSTVLLSNATGGDFATSADLATDVMAIFKIRAEEMDRAVNGIVGTTQASKFSINDYALALAQGGGVAASVGVNFEDFNATIAAISPLFASGSDAGTSFKTFLQRLVPQSDKAASLMKELGLMTEEGGNQFFDATGQMKSMTEVAKLMQRAFAGLSEEQRNEAASTIFGTDAMRAAFALAEAGGETIEQFKDQIGAANAEAAAATRMDTFQGSWEKMQDVIEATGVTIGKKFLPVARRVVDWIASAVTNAGPGLENVFGQVATWLDGTINSSGEFVRSLSGQFMPALKGVFSFITNTVPGAYRKFREIVDNVNDPGLARTINTIRASFAGLGKILGNLARPFKDAFGGLFQSLMVARGSGWSGIFDSLVTRLMTAVSRFGTTLSNEAVPFVLEKLKELGGAIKGWIDQTDWWGKISGWASAFGSWAGGVWTDHVSPALSGLWANITSWVADEEKRTALWTAITGAWDWLTRWAGAIWGWAQPGLEAGWGWLTSWFSDENKRTQLFDAVRNGWNMLTGWAVDIWEWAKPGLDAGWNWLTGWFSESEKRTQLWNGIKDGWTFVTEWAGALWSWAEPKLAVGWDWLKGWFVDPEKRKQLWDGITASWNFLTEWAGKIWDWASPNLAEAWKWLTGWVTDSGKRTELFTGIRNTWTSFTDWAATVWDDGQGGGLKPKLSAAWNFLASWITNPEKRAQLFERINATWTGFAEWAGKIWDDGEGGGVKTHLETLLSETDLWIDQNLPNVSPWKNALVGFLGEAKSEWDLQFPMLETRMGEFATNIEGSTQRIKAAFATIFGDGAETSTSLGRFATRFGLLIGELVLGYVESLFAKLDAFMSYIAAAAQMIDALRNGNWEDVFKHLTEMQFHQLRGGNVDSLIGDRIWERYKEIFGTTPIEEGNSPGGGSGGFRAYGGRSTFGGMTWVGERGPELVNLPAGSYVHTNAQSMAMAGGSGSQRIDLYVHGDSNLPQNRAALRELAIALQRELQLSGATTTRLALA